MFNRLAHDLDEFKSLVLAGRLQFPAVSSKSPIGKTPCPAFVSLVCLGNVLKEYSIYRGAVLLAQFHVAAAYFTGHGKFTKAVPDY